MKNLARLTLLRSSFVGLSFLAAGGANALIAGGGGDKGGATPELVLFIYDPVKEVSFSKDLGMYAAPFNSDNDNSKNFFVQAQQDAGYQKFFDPLNSDANFKEFLKVSTITSNQVWAIYATGNVDFFGPGSTALFTTLTSGEGGGVLNSKYTALENMKNSAFADTANGVMFDVLTALNNGSNELGEGAGANSFNSHYKEGGVEDLDEVLLLNGSSFDKKSELIPYYGAEGFGGLDGYGLLGSNVIPSIANPVGSSSWFYYVTPSDANDTNKVIVDEFDNLGHDGYWGLAVDTNGDYILSFTMESSLTAASTALGLTRRNRTDFSALYGGVRSVLNPANEFIGWIPNGNVVSAVPEPSSYGMFALGLLALGGLRARRKARLAA